MIQLIIFAAVFDTVLIKYYWTYDNIFIFYLQCHTFASLFLACPGTINSPGKIVCTIKPRDYKTFFHAQFNQAWNLSCS